MTEILNVNTLADYRVRDYRLWLRSKMEEIIKHNAIGKRYLMICLEDSIGKQFVEQTIDTFEEAGYKVFDYFGSPINPSELYKLEWITVKW